jgi:hypothetical protein
MPGLHLGASIRKYGNVSRISLLPLAEGQPSPWGQRVHAVIHSLLFEDMNRPALGAGIEATDVACYPTSSLGLLGLE